MTRRTAPALLALLAATLFVAGAASGCSDGHTPELSSFRFDGQAPDSPLVLLLSVEFFDPDQDLDQGVLETFINQVPTSAGPLPLLPIFVQSDVDPGTQVGRLNFVLELAFTDDAPPAGTTFTLGARVNDGAENTSNTQEVHLRLDF